MVLDLVIWTLNSERHLRRVLNRAVEVVPDSMIGKLIVVDGGSTDRTVKIASDLGWRVYVSKKKGIPFQANLALSHVSSEFFGGFEHDILLADNYMSLLHHFKNPNVGVAQGIRLPTHPVLHAYDWEIYMYQKRKVEDYGISLDNHIYDTDFMREIGGFPTDCMIAVDRNLRDRVENNNRRWVIDTKVVSDHIRDSLLRTLKHDYALLSGITRKDQLATMGRIGSVLTIPFSALNIMRHTHEPRLFPYLIANKLVRIAVILRRYNLIKQQKHR